MKTSSLTAFLLLSSLASAFAGPEEESDAIPVWMMRRINAVEAASHLDGETSSVTDAFNHLQDQLGRPHVKEVFFHPGPSFLHDGGDYFYWRGPKTGKRMKMSREKFFNEVYSPWLNNEALHPVPSPSPTPS
jgi:hypothetical protein